MSYSIVTSVIQVTDAIHPVLTQQYLIQQGSAIANL